MKTVSKQKHRHIRVVMVAPSRRSRGGTTTVVSAYERSALWKKYKCTWLETHIDGGAFRKLIKMMCALLCAPFVFFGRDIAHIHLGAYTSFYRKLLFFILARILCRKVIVHFHATNLEVFWHNKKSVNVYVSRYVLRTADRVIVLSEQWKKSVGAFCPEANVTVIPNPIEYVCPAIDEQKKNNTVLYLGKLEERKGFKDLLIAAGEIRKRNIPLRIVFAGHGALTEAEACARDHGIADIISLRGWVENEEREALLREASIFCLPSYSEGVPMALLEAMGYGLAIVATTVGGIPDVITHNEHGLLIEPGSSDALAKHLIRLLTNTNERLRLAEAARDRAHTFHINNVISLLGSLYEDMSY